MIDDTFDVVNGDTVNVLKVEQVRREDLNAVFTCQAVNNNLSIPVATSLKLDLTCKQSILERQ